MALVTPPIRRGIGRVESVEVDGAQRHAVLSQQFTEASEPARRREELDRRVVRRHHRAVVGDRDLLRPEKHLGGAGLDRLGIVAQDVPEQDLGQLVDERRRHVHTVAEERDIRRFDRVGGCEAPPVAQPDPIVGAGVVVGDRRDLAVVDVGARRSHQPGVQRELGRAGLGHRRELRAL